MNKHIKSFISIFIALTMLIPGSLPVFADNLYGFEDFPSGWSKAAMSHAVENGLIYGKSSDRIAPEDNLTRAEMATIINRAFGATVEKDISAFSDVSESAWYYKDIAKAYNMQTLYGDAIGTMRPDDFIIREEAIAIVARAMVLSGYNASNLERFKDKADISDWAVDPLASMAANGYVNGDENSNMNPKAFITREEFAQLLHNIIKHYYNDENKQETYQGNLMLNKPDISLEKIKVEGDLVLGDGVGQSKIKLTNVEITGRLLVRGAAQITLKNVTAGGGVTVKNVNGTVHFDNYRTEKIFDGVIEHTKVTYKQKGGGGGGSSTPTPPPEPPVTETAKYKVEHYRESLDGTTFELYETKEYSDTVGATVNAVAKAYNNVTGENEDYVGFSEDVSNVQRKASGEVLEDGSLVLKLYYTRNSYKLIYEYGDATTKGIEYDLIKYGNTIKFPESDTYSKDGGWVATGWYPNQEYKPEELLDASKKIEDLLDVKAGETEVTIYVKWAKYYVVTFIENSNSQVIGQPLTIVIEDAEQDYYVPADKIPGKDQLTKPYENGYFKNSSVSSVYNEVYEQHLIGGSWCYVDENGNDVVFTSSTKIESDLNVRYKFRYARLELDIENFDEKITLEVPFENGIRLIDSVKDGMFFNRGYIINAIDQLDAKGKLNSAYIKLSQAANEKGIELTPDKLIADDGEILKQHIKLNAFSYIDEQKMETTVVNAIKKTFKENPQLMRGVIDEMLKEQDEDVVDLMDSMLVSMLEGADAERIRGIIADAVVKAVTNDETGEFKTKIKDIIISELDKGNAEVEASIKKAVNNYFMNVDNDESIKEIVKKLINQAFDAQDGDSIKEFVKTYITDYLNANDEVLEEMIVYMGENLENNDDPVNKHIIGLIEEILKENSDYLEELVKSAVQTVLDPANKGSDLYNFVVDSVEDELTNNPDELAELIRLISDTNVKDLESVLINVMEDDGAFETIVKSAIANETLFTKIINTALNNDKVFEALVLDLCLNETDFYNMLVDIAISSDTLTEKVKESVIGDDEALLSVIKQAAQDPDIKDDIINEILAYGDEEIKTLLAGGIKDETYYNDALSTAKEKAAAKIKEVLAGGIDENENNKYWSYVEQKVNEAIAEKTAEIKQVLKDGIDESNTEYWPLVEQTVNNKIAEETAKIKQVLKDGIEEDENNEYWLLVEQTVNNKIAEETAKIKADLANGIDENENTVYWNAVYPKAKAAAENAIEDALTNGVDNTHTHWETIYEAALEKIKEHNDVPNIESLVEEALNDGIEGSTEFASYYEEIKAYAFEKADTKIKEALAEGIDENDIEYWSYVEQKVNEAIAEKTAEIKQVLKDGIDESNDEYWPLVEQKVNEKIAEKTAEIKQVLKDGIDESNDEYWPLVEQKVNEKIAEKTAEIKADLADGIDENDTEYWNAVYPKAVEEANKTIEDALTYGVDDSSPYWEEIYAAVKDYVSSEVENNFDDKLEEAMNDPELKEKVQKWASDAIADENSPVKDILVDFVKDLGVSQEAADIQLKNTIVNSVVDYVKETATADEKVEIIETIVDELNKAENSELKDKVSSKAIDILNADGNEGIKNSVISSVIDEISGEDAASVELRGDLIEELIDAIESDNDLKATVIDAAIDAVINDKAVNEKAADLLVELIHADTDDTTEGIKEHAIEHILNYILTDDDARDAAISKVIEKINDETDTSHKEEVIEFAFEALEGHPDKREEIINQFLSSVLNDPDERAEFAIGIIDKMFDNASLRNEILDIGFNEMFSDEDTIKEIVNLALDELIDDKDIRREMIIAVISTEDGRESIVNILFEELERDPTFIDDMVDIAMKGKYGDLVEKLIHEVVTLGKFEINGDNAHIAEQIVIPMLDEITADVVLDRIPEKFSKFLPEEFIENLFNEFMLKFKNDLTAAAQIANAGGTEYVNVMIDRDVDVMNEILVPSYNKTFPTLVNKAQEFYYYNENDYVKEIVSLIDPDVLLDNTQPASAGGTGYRLRSNEDYYELLRNVTVLADDAAKWYLDNLSDDQINSMVARFESAYESYLTKLNELVGNRIPMAKLDTLVDYMKKLVDKREKIYNGTTTAAFDKTDEAYDKIISFIKAKTGADISNGATVEVTFDGSSLEVNGDEKVNIDNYDISVTVGGNTFKIDSHSVTIAGQTIDISGYVQKIADTFGTKAVTVKFTEDAAYVYSLNVGENKVVLAAYYK